jgi:hypothetical protein
VPVSPFHYQITVTPLAEDGLPAIDRVSFEFRHADQDEWLQLLCAVQQLRGYTPDERAALVMVTQMLGALIARHPGDDLLAPLKDGYSSFANGLKQRCRGKSPA